MAEREETRSWTDADDEMVRRALATLRTDVDAAPLSDVRFVKARGGARRRNRFVAWTAAGAAAAVVVAAVGFSAFGGRDGAMQEIPAGPVPTTSGPTVPGLADVAGALPVAQEWTEQLSASPDLRALPLKEFDAFDCQQTLPGKPDIAQGLYAEGDDPGAAGFQGTQAHFTSATASDGGSEGKALVDSLIACDGLGPPITTEQVSPATGADTWPRVIRYTAENGGGGYYVVAQHERDVAYLSLSGNGQTTPDLTVDQVNSLAAVAQARLLQYGADGSEPAPPEASPTTSAPQIEAPIDQDMPVVGPDADFPPSLFVAASQWGTEELTKGYATEAAEGEYEGAATVASCDADTNTGGSFGIVSIRDRDGFIGKQRVRNATSIGDADQQVQALEDGFGSGCTFGNGTVVAEPGPEPRTWQLTTTYAEGDDTPEVVEYVGVTPFGESSISTLVITDPPTDKDVAFAQLTRLMGLAAQK